MLNICLEKVMLLLTHFRRLVPHVDKQPPVSIAIQGDVEIRARIHTLMEQSVTQSMKQVYDCGFDTYRKFMLLCNIMWNSTMPPISESFLMQFSTYCHQSLNLSYSTIKLYLCGIRYNYLIAGVANPFEGQGNNFLQLQMLLKGIKRNTTSSSRTRLPIDSTILYMLCKHLRKGVFNTFEDVMMETAYIVAFFRIS